MPGIIPKSCSNEDLFSSHILVVEDDRLSNKLLLEIFRKKGFVNVDSARNGREALEKVTRNRPDIIILDVMMPVMDGMECCRKIRAHANTRLAQVPIIFQTAVDGSAEKAALFAAGATDYIAKPVDPNEITARAIVHLEREAMVQRLRKHSDRLQQELELARSSQRILLPDASLMQQAERDFNLDICGYYQPSSELGGDLWGIRKLSAQSLALYVFDFSGHGVNAALNVFRLHTLLQSIMDSEQTPGEYLTRLNAALVKLLPPGQFATMGCAVIHTGNNTLQYAAAAVPPPVIVRDGGKTYELPEISGGLLGVAANTEFENLTREFYPGDGLLLYSDALIETEDEEGHCYEANDVAEILRRSSTGNTLNTALEALIMEFYNSHLRHLSDDLTLAAIRRRQIA